MNSLLINLTRISAAINSFSDWTGRAISWLTLLMVVVTFLVVVLRYVFQAGWIAMQESVLYMHGMVFLLGAAFTLRRDGHVRVDIFYREMSPKSQALVNLFGTLLFLFPTCGFIFFVAWQYVFESWIVMEASREAGGIPAVFLLKTVILMMAALVLLQGVSEVLRSVMILAGHAPSKED
jgi:TRAP-type mannitol/chloroaromatic compound transport system permease small subunit